MRNWLLRKCLKTNGISSVDSRDTRINQNCIKTNRPQIGAWSEFLVCDILTWVLFHRFGVPYSWTHRHNVRAKWRNAFLLSATCCRFFFGQELVIGYTFKPWSHTCGVLVVNFSWGDASLLSAVGAWLSNRGDLRGYLSAQLCEKVVAGF
jgi:hypothetical protein